MGAPFIITAGYLKSQIDRLNQSIMLLSGEVVKLQTVPDWNTAFNQYVARWGTWKGRLTLLDYMPPISNDTYAALKQFEVEYDEFAAKLKALGGTPPKDPNLPGEPPGPGTILGGVGLIAALLVGAALLASRKG